VTLQQNSKESRSFPTSHTRGLRNMPLQKFVQMVYIIQNTAQSQLHACHIHSFNQNKKTCSFTKCSFSKDTFRQLLADLC